MRRMTAAVRVRATFCIVQSLSPPPPSRAQLLSELQSQDGGHAASVSAGICVESPARA